MGKLPGITLNLAVESHCSRYMARITEDDDIQSEQGFGQPGKQRCAVFTVGIAVMQGFQREEVILFMELVFIGFITKRRLYEAQQAVNRFGFTLPLYYRFKLLQQALCCDWRQPGFEIV